MLSALTLLNACSTSAPPARDEKGIDHGVGRAARIANRAGDPRAERVRHDVLDALIVLDSALGVVAFNANDADLPNRRENVQASIARARLAYKRVEFSVEHFLPTVARALNGAPIDEIDDEEADRPLRPAEGLQVLEALADTPMSAETLASIGREASRAREAARRAVQVTQAYHYQDQEVFLAARGQLARLSILGLGGFDTPRSAQTLAELNASLLSIKSAMSRYSSAVSGRPAAALTSWQRFDRQLAQLRDTLRAYAATPDSLDRFRLLRDGLRPLALRLDDLRIDLAIPGGATGTPWRATAATPFERDALDPWAYAHRSALLGSAARLALGARLFHDTRLSGEHDRTCATCHDPTRAMTDGRTVLRAIRGTNAMSPRPLRNTPTLIHAALQPVQFMDGRVAFLEDQIAAVIEDPREMGARLSRVVQELQRSSADRRAFAEAFGEAGDSTVSPPRIKSALAAFVRSLSSLNAPFDRAVRGEEALSADATRGFTLFMGKARCGTCHFAPTFGGVSPPRFDHVDYEVLGVPARDRQRLDSDRGRGAVTENRLLEHAFRTPTLRNVAETAPYMHNGAFRTLEAVIDFYNAGGGAGRGLSVVNQTLPADSLHLSDHERGLLIAFLKTLSDDGVALRVNAQVAAIDHGRASTRGTRRR